MYLECHDDIATVLLFFSPVASLTKPKGKTGFEISDLDLGVDGGWECAAALRRADSDSDRPHWILTSDLSGF